MIEIAEAINNLAKVMSGIGTSMVVFGVLFLIFKNMGGTK